MSARVLNPAMMSEMGHRGIGGGGGARIAPSRAALARVRRNLFGSVDHVAARALAERELRAQSLLDSERWGFDFRLEIPLSNSRYEWEPITSEDIVPEPYALRGMHYLRRNAPGTPRKIEPTIQNESTTISVRSTTRKRPGATIAPKSPINIANVARKAERTPPQESRVPDIGDTTITTSDEDSAEETCPRKKIKCTPAREPTTPVLPATARKQQSSITDFMKSRKRTLNGTTKSIVELPEKIARNAGQIRS